MEWEEFKSVYAARFRPLTESDGVSEWKSFAATITASGILRKACDNIARDIAEIKQNNPSAVITNPKLTQIKNAFFAVIRENNERKDRETARPDCQYCHGTYLVEVAVGDGHKILVPEQSSILRDFKAMEVFPCPACRANAYLNSEMRSNAKLGYRKDNEVNDLFFQRFTDYDDWDYKFYNQVPKEDRERFAMKFKKMFEERFASELR